MSFGHDRSPTKLPSSVDEFRKQFSRSNSAAGAGQPPVSSQASSSSTDADRYARMLMTSYNIFRPLMVAAMYDRNDDSSDVLFEMDADEHQLRDKTNNVVRRISIYWSQTTELINHMRSLFSEADVDLAAPNNRWMFRVLWRQASDLVANAAINGKDVIVDELKTSLTASVILATGKEVNGLKDKDLVKVLREGGNKEALLEAFGERTSSYENDRVSALQLACFDATMRLDSAVNDFDFFQGSINSEERLRITEKLMEITQNSATRMYRFAVGVDASGQHNENYTRDINPQTQQQLMMRSISDSATIVEKTYRHYSKQARKSVLSIDDRDEKYRFKLKIFREGVPYEQIQFDTKQARYALNNAARPAVKLFAQLLDSAVRETPQNTSSMAEADMNTDSNLSKGEATRTPNEEENRKP